MNFTVPRGSKWSEWASLWTERASEASIAKRCRASERSERCERTNVASDRVALSKRDCRRLETPSLLSTAVNVIHLISLWYIHQWDWNCVHSFILPIIRLINCSRSLFSIYLFLYLIVHSFDVIKVLNSTSLLKSTCCRDVGPISLFAQQLNSLFSSFRLFSFRWLTNNSSAFFLRPAPNLLI